MSFDPNHPIWPTPETISDFSYSKLSHFELFRGLAFQSYNVGDPDPAICDLKVYQDYLTCCFICLNALAEIEADPDTYAMSQKAYEANWQPITKYSFQRLWSGVLNKSFLDGRLKL